MTKPVAARLRPTCVSGAEAVKSQGEIKVDGEVAVVVGGDDVVVSGDEAAEAQESRVPRVAKRPYTPTKAEVEEHLPLHIEYRSWCEDCVAGKGISHQHRMNVESEEEKLGITISMDYCFFSAEDKASGLRPILAVYDNSKRFIWAMAVESKGPSKAVVEWVVGKLNRYGIEEYLSH